ncbi:MAG: hypothetical protein GQ542_15610 [Desulforhopalus sp.]|jgi:hypothetical protein|nr:hypothetical protein [Desulforhopalus sp.]
MSTPIRAKFIEHMEFLGLAKQTQRSYINGVKGLAKYHNQSPENSARFADLKSPLDFLEPEKEDNNAKK